MADKPLFALDAEGRWRLAYDELQWILQTRRGKPTANSSGFLGVSFIASEKRVLVDVIREKGVSLTAEAIDQLDALPATFRELSAAPQKHVHRTRKAAFGYPVTGRVGEGPADGLTGPLAGNLGALMTDPADYRS